MEARKRIWLPLIVGGLVGLALGLGMGYFGRSPLYGTSVLGYVLIPLGIALILVIVLGVWAANSRSPAPRFALASLLVLGLVGTLVAPPPPGAGTSAGATVSIGTDADPAAYLAGAAECEWIVGNRYVEDVRGIGWEVRDPSLFEALDLAGPVDVESVHLGTGRFPIGREAFIEFGDGQASRSGSFTAFDLLAVAPDGTTGTARSKDGTIVIAWTCASGP